MALEISPTRGDAKVLVEAQDSHIRLQTIINDTHHYLYHFGHSWIYQALGKTYYQKCNKSWAYVGTHLVKFLRDQRGNYSLFMQVLEIEMQKFPANSFYGKQLKALADLVSAGPNFNLF